MWHLIAAAEPGGEATAERDAAAFVAAYRARATLHMANETRLYSSVVPTLRAAGMSLGVVSTKILARFEEVLQRAGTGFVAVTTGSTPRGSFDTYPRLAVIEDLSSLTEVLNFGVTS